MNGTSTRAAYVAAVLLAGAAACASPAPRENAPMVVLSVTGDGMLPQADLELAPFASVCWFAAMLPNDRATVRVTRTASASRACATSVGFADDDAGGATASLALGDCAVMCFHEPGAFDYTVTSGDRTWHGAISIREAQR